jgi:glycine/D-amino acid oxidase-like deaminating enzyme
MRKVDFVIIGQGIAGTNLALALLAKGKSIAVIDPGSKNESSWVAAGLFHIMTFRKLVKTWMGDTLIPFALKHYENLAESEGEKFLDQFQLHRIIGNQEEYDLWNQRLNDPDYTNWLSLHENSNNKIIAPLGFGVVNNAGRLNLPQFLEHFKNKFKEQGILFQKNLMNEDILPGKTIVIKSLKIETDHIVFCEGHHARNNPIWAWLPLHGTKGEVLDIRSEEIDLNFPINRKIFVLPISGGFKLGATYNWEDMSLQPTDKAYQELKSGWDKIIDGNFVTENHKVGIRPTVQDRRPLIGHHRDHENIWCFNGMGTKGVQISPYFSDHFAKVLLGEEKLMERVNLNRFFHLIKD